MFCDNINMTNYVVPVTGDKYCSILAKTNMGYTSFVSYFKKCSPLQKQESCDSHHVMIMLINYLVKTDHVQEDIIWHENVNGSHSC